MVSGARGGLLILFCSFLGRAALLSPEEKSLRHTDADTALDVVEYMEYIQRATGETLY